jgi:hypothetical protein
MWLVQTVAGVDAGYPRPITSDWLELPDNIQAAFTWPNNKATYFLKGRKYKYTAMSRFRIRVSVLAKPLTCHSLQVKDKLLLWQLWSL